MKFLKKYISLTLLLFTILTYKNIYAQNSTGATRVSEPTVKQKLRIADDLANAGSYYNAIDFYKEYLEKYPNDGDVMYKLAKSYYAARDYQNAEDWYKKAFEADKKANAAAQYYAALMMKYNGKYEEAKTEFEFLIKGFKGGNPDEANMIKKQSKVEADGCALAIQLIDKQPDNVKIEHLGSNINNPYSDFGPAPYAEKDLIFSSIKSDTVVVVGGPERSEYVCRVYKSTKNETTGKYGKAKEFGEGINNDNDHTGNGAFSPDGKLFYFTRCHEKSEQDLHMKCEIFVAKKTGNTFGTPEKLGSQVNNGSNNTQPAIGKGPKNELILYFVSDRDGGVGGNDLWCSVISKDGTCGEAKNCGKKINTILDENSPNYDTRDGVLYFSSNGRVNVGGYDVYKAKGYGVKFEEPENMGFPINSSCDDRYFSMRPNHKSAYVVSNRPGGFELKSATCCDDIFEISYVIIPKFAVRGFVYDERERKKKGKKTPLTPSLVTITRKGEKRFWKADTTFKRAPEYFFTIEQGKSYKLKAVRQDYYVGYDTVSTVGLTESDTIDVDIYLKKIDLDAVKIKGIFYDFDYWTLRPESKPALDSLVDILRENYLLIVEIGSHTDNKGSDQYNLELSQKRAQSVVDYLINYGIDGARLKAKGYGETMPDTINQNPDGSDCEVCRQKNRRTEFKVIGVLPNTDIIYEENDPEVIDSTKSTAERLKREKEGKAREQLRLDSLEIKKSIEEFEHKQELDKLAPPKEKPTEVIKEDQTELPKAPAPANNSAIGDKDKAPAKDGAKPAGTTDKKDDKGANAAKPAGTTAAKKDDKTTTATKEAKATADKAATTASDKAATTTKEATDATKKAAAKATEDDDL